MQRSVPSGFSYSQKPKARKKQTDATRVALEVNCTLQFAIGTLDTFPIHNTAAMLGEEKTRRGEIDVTE